MLNYLLPKHKIYILKQYKKCYINKQNCTAKENKNRILKVRNQKFNCE